MISLNELFPHFKSYTDIVSYATDNFASTDNVVFTTLPADVQCGDVIDATGALYTSGDVALIVASRFVEAGANKPVNVLRAPNKGSFVAVKGDNLNATDHAAAVDALEAQGFQVNAFHTY
ncbi:hypothetical protein ACM26M_02800 [Kluyvera cryocrescens]|uniref:hypothetical protein n=1 Tax=Kluyvera cryocrescens TaxID=580 RepID=UPI0039F67543